MTRENKTVFPADEPGYFGKQGLVSTPQHSNESLSEERLPADPMVLFAGWRVASATTEPWDGCAMTLATVGNDGQPSARVVLLRGVDSLGFHFFTHYESRKGCDLTANARCALVFWWPTQVRQVRVEGEAARLPASVSDAYFATRPPQSRIGAWASPQSREIDSRCALESRVSAFAAQFSGREIHRPAYWGGYAVTPRRIEFWQGGKARLHDRFLYTLTVDGAWSHARLAP